MRYVILGTAGHIDHGKSTLVEALTGVHPDRLKEEKERGITIDLGFADLSYDDGLAIGIVDVPGHERLIKNMLAGAGGIDVVLLVIAADEGIMPQSREHLNICNLLKIKSGLVAITKADMVEPDWVELVADEVRGFVKGTFLEGAPIVPISSKTRFNLDKLKATIHDIALTVEPKPTKGLFRLPIDRVFTMKGFGTVVTGTVLSGSVSLEEQVEVMPRHQESRIRGLHSHGKPVNNIYAGQRAAINLQSIMRDDLVRGDVVVTAGRFTATKLIDAKVELLPDATEMKNRALVHFHLGTSETVARVVIYGRESLGPGETGYCQFRLTEPVVAQSGDRYIVRRFSPLETIGGGEVLDPSPIRRKIKDGTWDLEIFERGTLEDKIAEKAHKASLAGISRPSIEGWIKAEVPAIRDAVGALKGKGTLIKIEDTFFHRDAFERFRSDICAMLKEFHEQNQIKRGMPKEEVRVKMNAEPRTFTGLVALIDDVVAEKDILALKGFSAAVAGQDRDVVVKLLDAKGFQPPSTQELAQELKMDQKKLADILRLMSADGAVKRLSDSLYMSTDAFDRMIAILKAHFARKDEMTVAEFRDMLATTRKFALPLLEYLDANGVTLRVGDQRKFLLK